MTCSCGKPAVVRYVRYVPMTRVHDFCGRCALRILDAVPARQWLRLEGIDASEVPMGRVA